MLRMSFRDHQLLPGETLIHLVHQHPVVLARPALVNVLCAAILAGLSVATENYWLILFQLVPAAHLFWEILVRRNREYVVTDRRVVKQEGVFAVVSSDAPLEKINNIFHEQNLWGRLLGYGTVGLETASERGLTMFLLIPRPVEFKNVIVAQREARKSDDSAPRDRRGTEDVPRLLRELAQLRESRIITESEFEAKKKALLDKL